MANEGSEKKEKCIALGVLVAHERGDCCARGKHDWAASKTKKLMKGRKPQRKAIQGKAQGKKDSSK